VSYGRVLIVDDSEESLKLLSGILGAEGYDVRPADSGELALAAMALSPPEVVLLDMRMPGMDGLEVCRKIKACPAGSQIPVIFLSASLDVEDRLEGLECGAVDFITKPFRREELLARLKTHLELARLRIELEQRVTERTMELQSANMQLHAELAHRRRVEEELRESEQRFRSMADTAPVGIWINDEGGSLAYVSQWCLDFSGCRAEELAGDRWLALIHPEDRNRTEETLNASVTGQRPFQLEFRLRRFDGAYRWTASTGKPRFVQGKFVGHIGSMVDISELKRIQEQAMAMQKLESLGVLAAGIAHDFNNLLSTILAYADLALHEVDEDSAARESVSNISSVAVRASEIVKLLLTYAGQADTNISEPVDLSALIKEMLQLVQISVPKTTALKTDLAQDLPLISGNSGQVRQIILNLVVNASESLEERPGTVAVSTSLSRTDQLPVDQVPPGLADGTYVLLKVSDTGCGMTEDTRIRIFDPFFSTKFLGRGLGLACVQGILRAIHGGISVTSSPGQGSIFVVWLPVWQGRLEAAQTRTVELNTPCTVLLIDDEDGLRLAVARSLQREGFSVLAARDGFEGIQLFTKHASRIGLIILDLTLPGMSGRDVWAEIRRLRSDVPVLFTTAQSPTGTDETDGGRFLRKPYRLREMINTIREMTSSSVQ
jgi:PAS domain S-box-containing protein